MVLKRISKKRAERYELEEHAGFCCEVPEHAVDLGNGLLHDLGDDGIVSNLSEDET
jgi:hypothetical protein